MQNNRKVYQYCDTCKEVTTHSLLDLKLICNCGKTTKTKAYNPAFFKKK